MIVVELGTSARWKTGAGTCGGNPRLFACAARLRLGEKAEANFRISLASFSCLFSLRNWASSASFSCSVWAVPAACFASAFPYPVVEGSWSDIHHAADRASGACFSGTTSSERLVAQAQHTLYWSPYHTSHQPRPETIPLRKSTPLTNPRHFRHPSVGGDTFDYSDRKSVV